MIKIGRQATCSPTFGKTPQFAADRGCGGILPTTVETRLQPDASFPREASSPRLQGNKEG